MQVLQIALDVSSALQHLSACGVFHCDLKTDNVMLVAAQGELAATASGCKFRAKLVDFGCGLTHKEMCVKGYYHEPGTLSHMAPEMWGEWPFMVHFFLSLLLPPHD